MPTYYAEGERPSTFVLQGRGFDNIPNDAVGVYSDNNDDPLQNKDTTVAYRLFDVIEKSSTLMVMGHQVSTTVASPVYLGAILSSDRQTVYWINESKPLP